MEGATSSPSEEFARQRRIVGQGALAVWRLRSLLKGLRGWQFFSRKALRWLTLVPLALVLISSLAFTDLSAVNALLLVQLLFYGLALAGGILVLLGRSGGPVFSVPFYILLIGAAGITGIFDTCRGQRFNVWEIPTLSRRGGDLTAAADGAQQMGRNPLRSDGRL